MNVFSEAVTMKSSYREAGNGVLRRFLAMRGRKNVGLIKPSFLEKTHKDTPT
jgi:hypothetical protein